MDSVGIPVPSFEPLDLATPEDARLSSNLVPVKSLLCLTQLDLGLCHLHPQALHCV